MTAAITLDGVTKRFGTVTAVDDLNLEFRQDVITGLLGRNGAGKTVTLSLVTAQERPTTGTIRVFGRNPRENASVLARTCFIRDTQRYPDEYRLEHILRLGPVLYGSWDIGLAHRIAGEFGIPRKRTLKKLSRGQLSAVAVLIATASRAPITIFDEPYLGMDATARTLFYDLLLADYTEHPRTIIISTHLIDEMENLFEDVVLLHAGRVRTTGNIDDFRSRALTLTGSWERVDALLPGRSVLRSTRVGAMSTVIVENSPGLATQAKTAGLTVEATDLHTLVAAYGLDGTGVTA